MIHACNMHFVIIFTPLFYSLKVSWCILYPYLHVGVRNSINAQFHLEVVDAYMKLCWYREEESQLVHDGIFDLLQRCGFDWALNANDFDVSDIEDSDTDYITNYNYFSNTFINCFSGPNHWNLWIRVTRGLLLATAIKHVKCYISIWELVVIMLCFHITHSQVCYM